MKKSKSSGATLLMGAKFSKITPRYWCSVGCLLIGLALDSSVVHQRSMSKRARWVEWKLPLPKGIRSKKEDKGWLRQSKMWRKYDTSSAGTIRPRRIGTNDSPA